MITVSFLSIFVARSVHRRKIKQRTKPVAVMAKELFIKVSARCFCNTPCSRTVQRKFNSATIIRKTINETMDATTISRTCFSKTLGVNLSNFFMCKNVKEVKFSFSYFAKRITYYNIKVKYTSINTL